MFDFPLFRLEAASSYAGETTITPMQYLTGYVGARRLL